MQQVITSKNLQSLQQNRYSADTTHKAYSLRRFFQWCEIQEENRFFWLGVAFMGNIGMVLPITLVTILFAPGNNFALWIFASVINVPVLAVNLAAQPTKVTLPFLFGAWLTNLVIILYSLSLILLA